MKICDSHIHIGQFRDIYTTPEELVDFLNSVGVGKFTVSSTTIWEENYDKVLEEITSLLRLAEDRVYPVLWITPSMLHNNGLLQMLGSGIFWRCIKIHGVHPWIDNIQKAVDVAKKLQVPFLMHTGGYEQCEAGQYLSLIHNNPDVTFILAHAQPIYQTVLVLQQCSNAWADIAFTPLEDIKELVHQNLIDRVLWGTDYPIQRTYYKYANHRQMYLTRLNEVRAIMSCTEFENLTYRNFVRLFD